MLPLFPKRRRKSLRFVQLENSNWKDRYFFRTARFTLVEKQLVVLKSDHNPRVIQLDKWEAWVYAAANGQITVAQFVKAVAAQYGPRQKVPKNLDGFLLDILEKFVKDYRIVELSEKPKSLPYYLSLPIHKQDERKASQEMQKDGFSD